MGRLDRWIVASKMVEVLDHDTLRKVMDLGGQIGGGWCEVHQHIHVTPDNKEKVEAILREKGFTVSGATDSEIAHPDAGRHGNH